MYSQLNCRSHNFKLTFTDTTMTPSSLSVIHYVYLYFSTFHVRRSREGLVVDVPQPSSLTNSARNSQLDSIIPAKYYEPFPTTNIYINILYIFSIPHTTLHH